ncbi:MAG: glycosyltransferase family 9 protein [Gammaproteobacteria bacterium]|nr:glycosyltransferase family 9 protein [Gammaproteobacteria bacterium]MCP5140312.1 glycosyltransferase family 9 protein [Chromatiales bacterium]
MFYKPDCRHFRGHVPCQPHKDNGYHCDSCPAYSPADRRILIIKLGAMGDVIRTTPLITRFRSLYPRARITWVTMFPDILPKSQVDEILRLGLEAMLYVSNTDWDIAINLDKEKEAAALLKGVNAREKFGFILKDGVTQPVNQLAEHKFRTGLFDDDSKANTRSYCTEIFEICGLEYRGEPYLLDRPADAADAWDIPADRAVVGLNTGCGDRWTTRLWSPENWVALAKGLVDRGYYPVLLGGTQEHERNLAIQAASGACYPGCFPLPRFISLMDRCELVVTQVTMALHLGLGLGKKVVLMNNIFNPHEFDLGSNGTIVQPPQACDCYYRGTCVHGLSCMESLAPQTVLDAVAQLLAPR